MSHEDKYGKLWEANIAGPPRLPFPPSCLKSKLFLPCEMATSSTLSHRRGMPCVDQSHKSPIPVTLGMSIYSRPFSLVEHSGSAGRDSATRCHWKLCPSSQSQHCRVTSSFGRASARFPLAFSTQDVSFKFTSCALCLVTILVRLL